MGNEYVWNYDYGVSYAVVQLCSCAVVVIGVLEIRGFLPVRQAGLKKFKCVGLGTIMHYNCIIVLILYLCI